MAALRVEVVRCANGTTWQRYVANAGEGGVCVGTGLSSARDKHSDGMQCVQRIMLDLQTGPPGRRPRLVDAMPSERRSSRCQADSQRLELLVTTWTTC